MDVGWRITNREIMATPKIGSSAILTIYHEQLGVNKKFARWVPHRLAPDQKQARVEWSQKMLERFDGGSSKSVLDIVTGDESWIYQHILESKCQYTQWVFPDEDALFKVKASRNAP